MDERTRLADAFLADAGWGGARRQAIAGDAPNRRYIRLKSPATGASAVLMDAPPEAGEDVRPFVRITGYLRGIGLSAPAILAADTERGFLLLEDLGDDLFARLIPERPEMEQTLYAAATDLLVMLHRQPPPDLANYDPPMMARLAALALDWYAPGATGTRASEADKAAFLAETETVLEVVPPGGRVLVQRDYHAENLLWLPDRDGIARVGQLDFQDAGAGHRAYDLMSLAEDARRDVDPALAERLIAHYARRTRLDPDSFRSAAATCAAQRNLRILGVFARLSLHFGKPQYVDLIPRVWNLLQRDLEHPDLAGLRDLCALPEPTQANLQILRDKCGTIPTL
ncbi:phosphotransferase [Aliiroseovarius sp.]|uniref:aminoglycoside phosphotransferase family protein n=1 Tax=Aliiroseovarius sp. TaxID=1872442 RepID=UPI00261E1B09|nr:phosphotransferase [Aliiroseovarius sp.]